MSIRNELLEEILSATSSGSGLIGRVNVTSAAQLSGALDSTKEYFLDGIVDFTGTGFSIEVPQGGLNLRGYNFDISGLKCDDAAYTMFTSPAGGSGNVLGADYLIDVNGAGSQVYDIVSDTGFEAFEFSRINYNNCTSLGKIDNYRQGLEVGTGRFGGSPSLELVGAWVGGFRITTSIVRSLSAGMTEPLFKAGAAFVMQSRFLTDINVDLPASSAFLDFAPANFPNPSTLQLTAATVTRSGVSDASDANLTPNIASSALSSSWSDNIGLNNTFEGGKAKVSSEALTTVTQNVFTDLLGTWATSGLQHFDSPSSGQLRHLGNSPREYKLIGNFVIEGSQNDIVTVKAVKWDNSTAGFADIESQTRTINQLQGARNVGFFTLTSSILLDQNDYVKIQVTDASASNDVTAELDSFFQIEER